MDVIYWLVPISVFVLFIAIAIFFWAVKADQFKDLDSPAIDILFDDDKPQIPQTSMDKTHDEFKTQSGPENCQPSKPESNHK